MKQLKFLKTITCDGKPVWYKDHIYQVMSEGASSEGRLMYKLICEDLVPRGIDYYLCNKLFEVIETEEEKSQKEEVKKEKTSQTIQKAQTTKKRQKSKKNKS